MTSPGKYELAVLVQHYADLLSQRIDDVWARKDRHMFMGENLAEDLELLQLNIVDRLGDLVRACRDGSTM